MLAVLVLSSVAWITTADEPGENDYTMDGHLHGNDHYVASTATNVQCSDFTDNIEQDYW